MNQAKTRFRRLKRALCAAEAASEKQQGLVMASISSASLPSPASRRDGSNPFAEIRAFWRQFVAKAFHPYRPELYYMRGPGPACRAKQMATSRLHST
jgi:hypothetical protein